MSKHSQKTLKTITALDTTPEDWGIAPYTVRKELRDMVLPCRCEGCDGRGHRYDYFVPLALEGTRTTQDRQKWIGNLFTIDEMYEAANYPNPKNDWGRECSSEEELSRARFNEINNRRRGLEREMGFFRVGLFPCQDCANGRTQHNRHQGIFAPRSTGRVFKMFYDVKCNVHYPAWPENTTFESKYDGCDCEACGKTIKKSATYAVLAKREDGTHTGLFVGNACVRKFGFKPFKTVDEQATRWTKDSFLSAERKGKEERILNIYERSKKIHAGVDVEVSDEGE